MDFETKHERCEHQWSNGDQWYILRLSIETKAYSEFIKHALLVHHADFEKPLTAKDYMGGAASYDIIFGQVKISWKQNKIKNGDLNPGPFTYMPSDVNHSSTSSSILSYSSSSSSSFSSSFSSRCHMVHNNIGIILFKSSVLALISVTSSSSFFHGCGPAWRHWMFLLTPSHSPLPSPSNCDFVVQRTRRNVVERAFSRCCTSRMEYRLEIKLYSRVFRRHIKSSF